MSCSAALTGLPHARMSCARDHKRMEPNLGRMGTNLAVGRQVLSEMLKSAGVWCALRRRQSGL
jgi:hypothetical protein